MFTTQFGEKISLNKGYELYNIVNKLIREAKDHCLDEKNFIEKDISVGEFVYKRLNEIIESGYNSEFTNNLSDIEFRRLAEAFLIWRCVKLHNKKIYRQCLNAEFKSLYLTHYIKLCLIAIKS